MSDYTVLQGDCLATLRALPAESVHCVVTSPPYYGLRSYGMGTENGEIGLEDTPAAYVARLVDVFREVWRVLRPDGVAWLNLGDSYNGSGGAGGDYGPGGLKEGQPRYPGRRVGGLKPKDLIGVPWRVAFALQDDGWWLRSDCIWHKPNPMPESVTDRPTKAHEYIFLLAKSERYFYDAEAVKDRGVVPAGTRRTIGKAKDGGIDRAGANGRMSSGNEAAGFCFVNGSRNRRSVWTVATQPYSAAHFATFPPALIEPCILAGTSAKGVCPRCGAQWVRVVERELTGVDERRPNHGMPGRSGNGLTRLRAGDPSTLTTGWQPSCECFGHFEEVDDGADWMTEETGTRRTKRVYVPDGLQPSPVPATVLDPFAGSGTTLAVALKHGRNAIGCELNPEYIDLIHQRCAEMSTEPIRQSGKVDDWSDLGLFAGAA